MPRARTNATAVPSADLVVGTTALLVGAQIPPLNGFVALRRLEFSYNEVRAARLCCTR